MYIGGNIKVSSSSKWFTPQKQFASNACNFIILSCSAFNPAFVANVATFFLSKSALFMNPPIADLSTKFLLIMLLVTVSLVNLLLQ